MKKYIHFILFLIVFYLFPCKVIFAKKIILKTNKDMKYLYINEKNNWNNLNEYIFAYKKIKNYKITEDINKNDCILDIKINKISFKLINYQNEYNKEIFEKKDEQSVFFKYLIELDLNYNDDLNHKIIVIDEWFNISHPKKKIRVNYIIENEEYLLYCSDDYIDNDQFILNIKSDEVQKYMMINYKDELLNKISKKIIEVLINKL